ncbi:MAG TPA: STAS/SEC14 domain-containing protein [Burkholderiaceae bacterium]|nr:STAS/SEC14 domain-containing protein [Burkholderiaceae bacterium]
MIEHSLDMQNGVLHLYPRDALDTDDFAELSQVVDPYILEHGGLNGLMIEADAFPGWDTFGAMVAHFRFVKDHHRAIRKVALVTDSPVGGALEHLASHFVSAKIKHFGMINREAAKSWVTSPA